jgi:hypothetical protein
MRHRSSTMGGDHPACHHHRPDLGKVVQRRAPEVGQLPAANESRIRRQLWERGRYVSGCQGKAHASAVRTVEPGTSTLLRLERVADLEDPALPGNAIVHAQRT